MTILSDAELDRLETLHPELKGGACPTCRGAGTYTWRGSEHVCDCAGQRRLFLRYLRAGIGLPYQRLSWEDLHVSPDQLVPAQEWRDSAAEYIDRGIGLLFSGPNGTGKTMVLMLIMKDLIRAGYDGYVTTFSHTVESFTATWGNEAEKLAFAERFMRTKVLGLDDLGKEFRNRLPTHTLDYILRTRVQNARPTILTTNMNSAQVRGDYGVGVLSMLVEQSIEVPLVGGDYRPAAHNRAINEVRAGERRPIV